VRSVRTSDAPSVRFGPKTCGGAPEIIRLDPDLPPTCMGSMPGWDQLSMADPGGINSAPSRGV